MDEAERAMIEEFDRQYRLTQAPARLQVELAVLGSDYGAASNTTLRQAAELIDHLRLGPEVSLLDLGAGSGWPGLYLASLTGCRVVLADQPEAGLLVAQQRAIRDGVADRCRIVRASGECLPFRDRVFDAISHADVLC